MEAAEIGEISDRDYQEYWDEMLRDQQYHQSKRMRSGMPNPLERGWTAAKPGGRRFGPPKSLEAVGIFKKLVGLICIETK